MLNEYYTPEEVDALLVAAAEDYYSDDPYLVHCVLELQRATEQLAKEDQTICWYRAVGHPWRKIAELLEMPKETARRRYHRALVQLAALLTRGGV